MTSITAREALITAATDKGWNIAVDNSHRTEFRNAQGTRIIEVIFTATGAIKESAVWRSDYTDIAEVSRRDKGKRETILEWLDIHAVTVSLVKHPRASLVKRPRVSLVKNSAARRVSLVKENNLPAEYSKIWGAELREMYRGAHKAGLRITAMSYYHETGHVDVVVFISPSGVNTIAIGQVCDMHGNVMRRDISRGTKTTDEDGNPKNFFARMSIQKARILLSDWIARAEEIRAAERCNLVAV